MLRESAKSSSEDSRSLRGSYRSSKESSIWIEGLPTSKHDSIVDDLGQKQEVDRKVKTVMLATFGYVFCGVALPIIYLVTLLLLK